MKLGTTICILIAGAHFVALAQPSAIRIPGVEEPPELTGEPKKFTPPSDAMKQFAASFPKDENNLDSVKTGISMLNKLLQETPTSQTAISPEL